MAKSKKKSDKESFSLIPTRTIISPELNNLSVNTRWLYVVMTTGWRRDQPNNEYLFTYEQLREITHFNYSKIRKCLLELERAKFIYIEHGRLCNKPNRYKMNYHWLHQYMINAPMSGNI